MITMFLQIQNVNTVHLSYFLWRKYMMKVSREALSLWLPSFLINF